jgi:hypothetical protein
MEAFQVRVRDRSKTEDHAALQVVGCEDLPVKSTEGGPGASI